MKITKQCGIFGAAVFLGVGAVMGASYNDSTAEGSILGTWPHLDITSVEVYNTSTDITFAITVVGNPVAVNWGQYNIGIDSIPGGSTNGLVPPNRPISISSGMDYWVRSWNDGAETYHWNAAGSNWAMDNATWSPPSDIQAPSKTTSTVTLTTTLASLGLSAGDSFYFDVYTSGGTSTDSAVDALANPLPTSASGNWVSPYDSGTNVYQYTVTGSLPPTPPTGAGAALPYLEYEAEEAVHTGTIIGPSRTYLNQASEASGRRAVQLNSTGQYVEFTLEEAANSIVVRYCIPDSTNGEGLTNTLSLYTNGAHCRDLALTSKFSWVYGAYPYSNTPAEGSAHHFYDETSALLDELPAGSIVRLQKDAGDTATYYLIDLVDFENVPAPQSMPAGFLSVASYGATPDDASDDTVAIKNAVAAAQAEGKGLWIPPGRFTVTNRVNLNGTTLQGAGPWYSLLQGARLNLFGNGGTIKLSGFKLDGQATTRTANVAGSGSTGIEGIYGSGSVISNVWIEHTVPGMWINGPTTGLLITGCRMRNTFADGINLAYGVVNTTVEHCSVRNTGDDAMAMWSDTQFGTSPNVNNTFRNNTIQVPLLANGVGLYGGSDNSVVGNWIRDVIVNGAGIQIANRFVVFPFGGTTLIAGNHLERAGSYSPDFGINAGALWLFAHDGDMTAPMLVTNNLFADSSHQGILLSGSNSSRSVSNVTFAAVNVDGAGAYGIQINTRGAGLFQSVNFTNTGAAAFYQPNPNFQVRYAPDGPPASTGPFVIGNVAEFNWPAVIDWDGGGLSYHLRVGTAPGASNVWNATVSSPAAFATNSFGNTLYAFVSVVNNGSLEGPASGVSEGVSLLTPDGDEDNDGMSNELEKVAGTDPFDAESVFRILSLNDANGLTWSSVSNKTYVVEAASNLAAGFGPVSGMVTAAGPETAFAGAPFTNTAQYYRVKVLP